MNHSELQGVPGHPVAAPSPWSLSRADWAQVIKRSWKEMGDDNVGLIAAGVAFYCFTAIVPALASIVLSYGLLTDPETVSRHVDGLFGMLPQDAAAIISDQLVGIVETSKGQQGLGLLVALAIALYGVTKATSSMIVALNVAYDEKETRSFVLLTVLSLLIVIGGVALVLAAAATTTALAFLGSLIPSAPGLVLIGIRVAAYLLLAGLVVTAIACLYRYAPSRPNAKWVWLSPGALLATMTWLSATAGFGFYASNFGNYNATYGSLGAVVVLLTWLWLSAYVFLLGAQLNSELERQTSHETLEDTDAARDADADAKAEPTSLEKNKVGRQPEPPRTLVSVTRSGEDGPGVAVTAAQLKAGAVSGGAKLGVPTALLAGLGLTRLRRGSPFGFALVAGAAAIAWTLRSPPVGSGERTSDRADA